MRSKTDLAWAAGLFEGEGFLVQRNIGQRAYLQLGIEMRDVDIIRRFVRVLSDHDRASTPVGDHRNMSEWRRKRGVTGAIPEARPGHGLE